MGNNGGVYTWSPIAANNATADSTVNYQEGQAPSSLNDSARAAMASVAKYRDDISGMILTTGTSTAYIVGTNQVFDSLADMGGKMICFTPHVTNGAGPVTLNPDELALIPLRSSPNVELPSGVLIQGTPYAAIYNAADNAFYLQGFYGNLGIPLLCGMDYWSNTAPASNFIVPLGQALSRTAFPAAFAAWGTMFGPGDGSTTFNAPNKQGKVSVMLDASGAVITSATMTPNGNTLGALGGAQTVALTAAQVPEITSNVQVSVSGGVNVNTSIGVGGGTVSGVNTTFLNGAGPASNFPGSGSFSGSGSGAAQSNNTGGAAHDNMQPSIMCNYIIRVL